MRHYCGRRGSRSVIERLEIRTNNEHIYNRTIYNVRVTKKSNGEEYDSYLNRETPVKFEKRFECQFFFAMTLSLFIISDVDQSPNKFVRVIIL